MDLAYLWFWIVGFLFVGYFVLDGFDFGVGMSLPFLGKNDISRRQIINTIGPVWDLNETWVIVAGACLFAAFPEWYATLFSGFYLALLLILLALILRGVSFEYRHQRDVAAVEEGVRHDDRRRLGRPGAAVGRRGRQHRAGRAARRGLTSSSARFLTLLNPYGLLGGLTTLLLFFTHGVYFVALKTDGQVAADARRLARRSGLLTIVVAAIFLVWTVGMAFGEDREFALVTAALSAVAAVLLIASWISNARGREGWAFGFGAFTIVSAVLAVWFALFPFVMPSTGDPAGSPHDRERLEHRLHADDHVVGGADLPSARARLPGLDVLDLPQAHHPLAHRAAAAAPAH